MRPDLLDFLRCSTCGSRLSFGGELDGNLTELRCGTCSRIVPVKDGIPRFGTVSEDEYAKRTEASFGYEWSHYHDWRHSGETNFQDYFVGLDLTTLQGRIVLDAGCGMGRHARQIAAHAGRVVAVDFSRAIDQAAQNVADVENVDCIQGDLLALPLADRAFDYVYSLGVLHHLVETERALGGLVRKAKPGGRVRVYLYWKRHGWPGRILRIVTMVRRVTTRIPFWLLRWSCFVLSLMLYAGVIVPYRVLSRLGVEAVRQWPLFVYTKYPFRILENDQFDRFSAPIEKRYDADEVRQLLERAGLRDVKVWGCFGWVAEGSTPC